MRQTIANIIVLLAVPTMLLPILLGASDALDAQRREHYFRMRREHMRRLAIDRHRRAERLHRMEEPLRVRKGGVGVRNSRSNSAETL